MSAALGRVQMSRLDELLEKRERVAAWYQARLAEMPGVELLQISPSTSRMSWFVYVVRLDEGIDRKRVTEQLDAQGVPTRPYFTPIHLQRYMTDRFGYKPGNYPVTEDLSRRSLALPFSGTLRLPCANVKILKRGKVQAGRVNKMIKSCLMTLLDSSLF